MQRIVKNINNKQSTLDCLHNIETQNSMAIGNQVNCSACDKLVFPEGLNAYKKTPVFNQETIPKGFRRAHSTKKGIWALITVISGKVRYVVDYLDGQSFELDRESRGVISPQMEHHLEVIGNVELYVEFYAK